MPDQIDPARISDLASQLGMTPGDFVREFVLDPGLPEPAVFPAKLSDAGIDFCLRLGMNPADVLMFRQEIDAQAEAFAQRAAAADTRSRDAKYQAGYRAERGDEYRKRHADYMRDWRARRANGDGRPGGQG